MNLEQRLRRLEFVHRTARLTSWVWDIESDAVHWFGEPEALLGLPEGGFSGRFPDYLTRVHPEDAARARATFIECLKGLRPHYRGEERLVRPDGSVRWVETFGEAEYGADGRAVRMAGVVRDITDRKVVEEQLAHQLYHDALTGLPNRALLMDRLAVGISQARRKRDALGLLVVDLDRFHDVTSGLGHEVADAVLCKVAHRLAGCVRGGDTLARISGSEFALVLSDLARTHDAGVVARKVLDAMAAPVALADGEVFLTSSVGIAMYPHDGADGERLLQAADAAMVQARACGPNHLQLYSEALGRRTADNLALQQDLRHAVEREEFLLHYQPRADLASGRITGFEALLRWNRPGRGMVEPADFIPLLEESGLIVPVGEWVVRQACLQLQEWLEAGVRAVPVAVNVSARQFLQADLAGTIERALCRHGVPAPLLEVEITETDSMRNADEAVATLARLRAAGVGVAIDDFGTGYSSLAYLKRFRVDALKLDRSFVRGLPQDAGDVSIARAVIGMAHGLGLRTVAEGVETPAQRAFLAGCGCNEMQGFLLARPLPARQCAAFLAQPPGRIGADHVVARIEDGSGDRRGEGHRRRHGGNAR
jgi:diguanylate cyclase (GGDEF)-like protein/PAS domain S-box-containing protein